MTTKNLTGTFNSGYVLNASKYNALYIEPTGTVKGSGVGLTTYATVGNSGLVSANKTSGDYGIFFEKGGYLQNGAGIYGGKGVVADAVASAVENLGSIGGYTDAILLNAGGVVANFGTIAGGANGVNAFDTANVENYGLIATYYRGAGAARNAAVNLEGGVVSNLGTISGDTAGVVAYQSAAVYNVGGTIIGDIGVHLRDGGSLSNSSYGYTIGLIDGFSIGVSATSGQISNYAEIKGGATGVVLGSAATLINGSALLSSSEVTGVTGVSASGSSSVENLGEILGTGTTDTSAGVYLNDSTLSNGSAKDGNAVVDGYNGVSSSGGGTVNNFGVIETSGQGDHAYAVDLSGGGTVVNGSATSRTAEIVGYGAGVASNGAVADVYNFAEIFGGATGTAVLAQAGGFIVNGSLSDQTALMEGATGIAVAGATTVENFGTVDATVNWAVIGGPSGEVINGGATDKTALIEGYAGVDMSAAESGEVANFGTIHSTYQALAAVVLGGGSVTNGSGADTTALIEGGLGVNMGGSALVTNFGLIEGDYDEGVILGDGGRLVNGVGADTSATIEGAIGVLAYGATATVVNLGTIIGEGYGVGVDLDTGGAVDNGSVTNRKALIEGYDGVYIAGAGSSVNFGTILGLGGAGTNAATLLGGTLTNGGVGHTTALIDGYTGVGASNTEVGGSKVINFGTIDGEGGVAVQLNASSDDLVVEAGSVFIGAVIGTHSLLELGSGVGTLTSLLAGGDVTVSGSMATTTFDGFGTVQIDTGASFTLAGSPTVAAGYGFNINGSASETGTLTVAGDMTVAGTLSGTGSLNLSGSAAFDAGTDLTIAKVNETAAGAIAGFYATSLTVSDVWTQTAGTVTVATGDKVAFTGTGDVFDGTLTGAGTIDFTGGSDTLSGTRLTATSVVINGASVTLSGSVVLGDTVSVTSPDLTVAAGGATLSGSGSLSLSTTATNEILGGPLTNASRILGAGLISVTSLVNSGTIQASSTDALTVTTGTTTLVNSGLIESTSTGGLTITGALSNTGSVEAVKGTILVDGSVSGAGTVKLDGGTVDLAGAFSGAVDYLSAGGVLVLAHSKTDTVTITGFPKTSIGTLDLQDIKFTGATETFSGTATSGTLTIKNGANIATITLEGNYTTSTFTLSADSSGGTIVTDPVKTPVGPPPLQPLVSAIASFGASAGGGGSHPTLHTPDRVAPLLASAA